MTGPEELEPAVPEPEQPEVYPFWTYKDLAVIAGLALPCLLVAAIVVRAVLLALPGPPPGRAAMLLPAQFLGYGLWFLCLYALLRMRYQRPFWSSLAWFWPKDKVNLSLWSGPALAFGIAIVGVLLRTPQIEMPMQELLSDQVSIILVGLFATTLGPLCEELAFRGFLFPLVARSFGPAAGVIITALPFAVLHGPQYAWSWRHVLLITVAGAAFGWMRHRTGSTATATLMHATYNLTFFAAFVMQGRNMATPW